MAHKLTKHSGHLVEGLGWTKEQPSINGPVWSRFGEGPATLVHVDVGRRLTHWPNGVIHDLDDKMIMNRCQWAKVILSPDAPAQDYYKAEEVEAMLNDLARKWAAQTFPREGLSFRLAMKSIQGMLDQLRKGQQ
jgi:hypothetical protein